MPYNNYMIICSNDKMQNKSMLTHLNKIKATMRLLTSEKTWNDIKKEVLGPSSYYIHVVVTILS